MTLKEELDAVRRRVIFEALQRHQGCRTFAARDLGMNRTTLVQMMKRLSIAFRYAKVEPRPIDWRMMLERRAALRSERNKKAEEEVMP